MKYFFILFSIIIILIISVENKGPKPKTTTTVTSKKPENCVKCDYFCDKGCDDILPPVPKSPCLNTIQICKDIGCCEKKNLCFNCDEYCNKDCEKIPTGGPSVGGGINRAFCRDKQASCKRNECCEEIVTTKKPLNCINCKESCNKYCEEYFNYPEYFKYCKNKKQKCIDKECCERRILCNKCDEYCDKNCTKFNDESKSEGDFRCSAIQYKQGICERYECCKEYY